MENAFGFRPNVRVRIIGKEPFFGPGTAELLNAIIDCGSVAGACEKIQLSYSKGRLMIQRMEQELGYPIVSRIRGGHSGGCAKVTLEGVLVLEEYKRLEEKINAYAQDCFKMMEKTLQRESIAFSNVQQKCEGGEEHEAY